MTDLTSTGLGNETPVEKRDDQSNERGEGSTACAQASPISAQRKKETSPLLLTIITLAKIQEQIVTDNGTKIKLAQVRVAAAAAAAAALLVREIQCQKFSGIRGKKI